MARHIAEKLSFYQFVSIVTSLVQFFLTGGTCLSFCLTLSFNRRIPLANRRYRQEPFDFSSFFKKNVLALHSLFFLVFREIEADYIGYILNFLWDEVFSL